MKNITLGHENNRPEVEGIKKEGVSELKELNKTTEAAHTTIANNPDDVRSVAHSVAAIRTDPQIEDRDINLGIVTVRADTHRSYDSRQIANWFINCANHEKMPLSVMKLVKLVYMAHGWCLAALDRPLIMDEVQAWDYGPIIPDIYYTFRTKDMYNAMPTFSVTEKPLEPIITQLLKEVWELYKNKSTSELSDLTHIEGGPWDKVYRPSNRFSNIPKQMIAAHYKEKIKAAQNG
ncbi:MAG: DUF4065 domain-containing protein [Aestuariivita sp.]|nr:DUF4065 domain-containing protein [Aestuariivita sp.]